MTARAGSESSAPPAPPTVRDARVAVLLGGTSSEHDISLLTGKAVLAALVDTADGRGPRDVLRVEIGRDGRWDAGGGARPMRAALAQLADVDVCFLALHGGDGEDGHVQGLLSMLGIPFTGSGVAGSALCLDKWNARTVAVGAGLVVADAELFSRATWTTDGPVRLVRLLDRSPAGLAVKPRKGGSSVLSVHARYPPEAHGAIEGILESGDDALAEVWVTGLEGTCAVLGNGDAARALTPIEIRPHPGRFFDYEEKYSETGAIELCPPERLSPATCERMRAHALAAHRALGCDGYSRSDFVVPHDGPDGSVADAEPLYLETNTLPGLTPRSLFPLAAREAGLGFRDLCLELLELGLARGCGT
jgi:D-alanine-D-alanine ligase